MMPVFSSPAAGTAHAAPPSQEPAPAQKKEKPSTDPLANKEVFLQLLVAQIRNQNPLNPANGLEFVAQLAQFSELEATLEIRQDLARIREVLAPADPNTDQKSTGTGPA